MLNEVFSSPAALLIGFGVLALLAIAGAFAVLRSFRADLAKEIEMTLAAAKEAQAVQVQSPLEVREHTRMATYAELLAVEMRLARLEARIDTQFDKFTVAAEERARRLHSRMDDLLKGLANVQGQLERIDNDGR